MGLKIRSDDLKGIIERTRFADRGDPFEQKYWQVFSQDFPRLEEFWRWCIVPGTQRVEQALPPTILPERKVAPDLQNVFWLHYSTFLNLVHAYERLQTFQQPGSLSEFYFHLGAVCDLADDFLIGIYLLVSSCRCQKPKALSELTRTEFLEMAGEWYDVSYSHLYEHYLAKGKGRGLNLPSAKHLVKEYLAGFPKEWKEYANRVEPLRQYRNFLTHDIVVGEIHYSSGTSLIPRKESLRKYKKVEQVFAAANDPQLIEVDFAPRGDQMRRDFFGLQKTLNIVWEKPLRDMTTLLYVEQNETILEKYGFEASSKENKERVVRVADIFRGLYSGSAISAISLHPGATPPSGSISIPDPLRDEEPPPKTG